jgi:hypothetical protein
MVQPNLLFPVLVPGTTDLFILFRFGCDHQAEINTAMKLRISEWSHRLVPVHSIRKDILIIAADLSDKVPWGMVRRGPFVYNLIEFLYQLGMLG